MSEPEDRVASITSTPRASPLTTRLRRGKFCGNGGVPGANSETMQTAAREVVRERPVLRRIDTIGSGADDGDAAARSLERAAMRGGVDAEREPAHDREPGIRQRVRERARVGRALRRCVAAADDGECGLAQELAPPHAIEDGRRIGDSSRQAG